MLHLSLVTPSRTLRSRHILPDWSYGSVLWYAFLDVTSFFGLFAASFLSFSQPARKTSCSYQPRTTVL
jgi:hypothetical protein